ncbi:MAG: ferritin [Ignavibacteria bacterium]|nr:ferritin [Ignavibacteria bacterium]
MLKPKLEGALNLQLNKEFYSSYLYLSMAAYFEGINLAGFANWMRVQTQEEYAHAMKFFDYIVQKGGKATLEVIAKPENSWDSPLAVYEATYEHEKFVTQSIDDLVNLAYDERDHATIGFLQWFVTEQVEEEANVTKLIDELKMVADNKTGLFMLDRELATRVFTPPPANNA